MKVTLVGAEVSTSITIPDPDAYTGMSSILIERVPQHLDTSTPFSARIPSFSVMLTPEQLDTLGKFFIVRAKQLLNKKAAA
jgi:hypothetical protein